MERIGGKIKHLRKVKGLSQEELAESAKVNLRTIQRIENNESEPRGSTLNLICKVLDIHADDILDYGKQTDENYLIYFHLSVLSCVVIPLGNIILPLILWLNKKDKIIGLKSVGANLLNFQIIWSFLTFLLIIIFAFLKINHWELGPGSILLLYSWVILCEINIILSIVFAIMAKKGKIGSYYPNLFKFIK